jgi:hypothetical protein
MAQLQANNYSNIQAGATPTHGRSCHHCGSQLTHFARFCGECGASGLNTGPKSVVNFATVQALSPIQNLQPVQKPDEQPQQQSGALPQYQQPLQYAQSPEQYAQYAQLEQIDRGFQYSQNPNPAFAVTPPPVSRMHESAPRFAKVAPQITHVDPTLRAELAKNILLLARERLFLYLHCLNFLAINLFGFWLSLKAYNEYNADELTKTVIALTPLMFINSLGLVCLSPIKGTKLEIARLKEKIKYIRVQIEYRNITL